MKTTLRALILVACIATSVQAADPSHAIVKSEAKRVKATLTFTLDTPDIVVADWIIFAPIPPVLPSQRSVTAVLEGGGVEYRELSERKRKLLRAQISTKGKPSLEHQFHGKAEFAATLMARKLVVRESGKHYGLPDAISAQSREFNLASSKLYDFKSEAFTDWLEEEKLYRRKNESELHFARRAFLAIKDAFAYEYTLEMNRIASHVCEAGKSDCGGLSVLFVSVMRANGLPARSLAGCWAKSSKPGATLGGVNYNQVHVKAEVHLTDIGWVPVDVSSAISHDKTPEGLYCFGNDKGDFLTMHVDPEITVDTIYFGEKTVNFLQQYHYYVTGKGMLTNTKQTINWLVETE